MRLLTVGLLLVSFCNLAQSQPARHYAISTIAGQFSLGDGGPATSALIESPLGTAVDRSGNVYFIDRWDNRVRRITPAGVISTLAVLGSALDVAADPNGNIIVAGASTISRVTPAGVVTRIAGGDRPGSDGDGGPAANAAVAPYAISVDAAGNVYIAEFDFNKVRRIGTDGIIRLVAGTGQEGFSGDNGPAASARLNGPSGVVADPQGNVYLTDTYNFRVRRVNAQGVITTVAGAGFGLPQDGTRAATTGLGLVEAITIDENNSLIVCDTLFSMIYRITSGGELRIIAGTGTAGFTGDGGAGRLARLNTPYGVALRNSVIYFADSGNDRIRQISADGNISTIGGRSRFAGDGGRASDALLYRPSSIVRDAQGNLILSDSRNHRIRRITPAGIITTIAGNGTAGFQGDNGPAVDARLNRPTVLALGPDRSILFVDSRNNRVRRIAADGTITTFAGAGEAGDAGDGAIATLARFRNVAGIAVDSRGAVYISDSGAQKVRRVDPDGIIRPFAGTGMRGLLGNGGLATAAQLAEPWDLAVDAQNNVYIADLGNGRIRRVNSAGIISTFAGDGSFRLPVEGQPAAGTGIGLPAGMVLDAAGNMIVASSLPSRVFVINTAGIINTIAGGGEFPALGDGGPATLGALLAPLSVALDPQGDVYVADTLNHRIRRLMANNPARLEVVDGSGQTGPAGSALERPLRVRVVGAAAVNVPGVSVVFQVTAGRATLSSSAAQTDATGVAGIGVTLGETAGEITITATVPGLQPVTFRLTATAAPGGGGPGGDGPQISDGGVAGAGLSIPAVRTLSANMIASVFGLGFAPAGTLRAAGAEDIVDGRIPDVLAGVCVLVGERRAGILLVTPTQINIIIPEISGADAAVQVITDCGSASEKRGNVRRVAAASASPEFFYFLSRADGRNPVAAILHATGERIGDPGMIPGVDFRRALPGDVITIFGTGFGATSPASIAGAIAAAAAATVVKPVVQLGGVTLDDSAVIYAGVSPFLAGVYQLSIRIPDATPEGNQTLVIRFGSLASPPNAVIAIGR